MKAFIVAILLIIVSNFYCQFEVIKSDSTKHYYALQYAGADSVIVGGVLDSIDGIEKYNMLNHQYRTYKTQNVPSAIFSSNSLDGWILCQDGHTYTSDDDFSSINEVVSNLNILSITSDILFVNDTVGFVCQNSNGNKEMFKTTNKGGLWSQYLLNNAGGDNFVYESDSIFCVTSGGAFVSDDIGNTWYADYYHNISNRWFSDLYKKQEKMIFVGQGFNGSINFGAIVVSNDYGQTFQEIDILGLNRIMDIEMVNDTLGYVVGQPQGQIEAIYKTIDGGYSWDPVGYVNDPTHFIRLHKIKCLDENNCYACGLYGTIMKTTNGGGPMLGISEINPVSNDNVTVYPNPSMDYITVISEKFINEVSLYDYKGALVKQQNAKDFQTQIDISVLAKGFYLLKINTNDGIVIKKIEKL
jgi:photosystem II stability/assembly factor-like uncharacterized protein